MSLERMRRGDEESKEKDFRVWVRGGVEEEGEAELTKGVNGVKGYSREVKVSTSVSERKNFS